MRETTPKSNDASAPTPTPPTTATPAIDHHAARLNALVISDKIVVTYPLPETGEVKIGRSPQCEILIDEPSISRTHATLGLGPPMVIRDLGSANGVTVRGRRLQPSEPAEIAAGEAVQIGAATLIIQRQAAPIRPRRLWTHDYFEVRLEEECAAAARRGSCFAVMRLSCTSRLTHLEMQQVVTDLVRQSDVVGEYGPNDFELLLLDTDPEELESAIRRFQVELEKRDIGVRVGTACYPRDGRNADELMARAEAIARGIATPDNLRPRVDLVAERTMQDLYTVVGRIANGTISVLILGETGVGKEVLAEQVHKRSPRAAKPYLKLNCAALSETLLESELFGHERGAFTGAVGMKQGLLETADGGSVFLDELGELPLQTQVKLLRVIEERVVMRVGGLKTHKIDVRFIAATNRDLEAEIARGTFRQDLYFRLNGATLVIPPLRERPTEIPGLAQAFLETAARQAGLDRIPDLSDGALQILLTYSWPGNIRELRNVIERAVLLCGDGEIVPRHLPLEKMRVTLGSSVIALAPSILPRRGPGATHAATVPPVPTAPPAEASPASDPVLLLRRGRHLTVEEERARIEAALDACGGNQTRAAKSLGIARRTLINRVKEFGLARPRGKSD